MHIDDQLFFMMSFSRGNPLSAINFLILSFSIVKNGDCLSRRLFSTSLRIEGIVWTNRCESMCLSWLQEHRNHAHNEVSSIASHAHFGIFWAVSNAVFVDRILPLTLAIYFLPAELESGIKQQIKESQKCRETAIFIQLYRMWSLPTDRRFSAPWENHIKRILFLNSSVSFDPRHFLDMCLLFAYVAWTRKSEEGPAILPSDNWNGERYPAIIVSHRLRFSQVCLRRLYLNVLGHIRITNHHTYQTMRNSLETSDQRNCCPQSNRFTIRDEIAWVCFHEGERKNNLGLGERER
jgi:hypothetical protein